MTLSVNRNSPAVAPQTTSATAPKTAASTTDSGTAARNAAQIDGYYNDAVKSMSDLSDVQLTDTSGKNNVSADYWFSQSDVDQLKQPYMDALNKLKSQQPPLSPADFKAKADDIVAQFKGPGDGQNPGLQTQQSFISIFMGNVMMSMNRMYANIMKSFGGG